MVFSIYKLTYQTEKEFPVGFENAMHVLNREQTVWKLKYQDEIVRQDTYKPNDILNIIPVNSNAIFSIGVTKGRVDLNRKISLLDDSKPRAVICDFEWQEIEDKVSSEVFWIYALANICFQTSINRCTHEKCLGYTNYKITNLNSTLLNLFLCHDCRKIIINKYKYHIDDFNHVIDILKNSAILNKSPYINKPHLPTFDAQVRRLNNKPIFNAYGIIMVMHFLENLVHFIEALISLGAKKESIALIVKPYPYSHRHKVHAYLYENYPDIRVEYLDDLPPSNSLIEELLSHCKSNSLRGKVLVIEDGGYIMPFIHSEYSMNNNFCIGAVEQTTKGIKKDEKIEKDFKKNSMSLYFPVLNVAKSKFKDVYESPLVGRSVSFCIQNLLNEHHLSGKIALVIGYGSVGKEIAKALHDIGMVVKIYDSEPTQIAAAKNAGYIVSEAPYSLVSGAKLIIGTTGSTEKPSISRDILKHMDNGTIIVSASSDRKEIDIEKLRTMSDYSYYEHRLGTYFVRNKDIGQDKFLLLADGWPINFYFESGIPTTSIDPVLAQLLIGAVHVATHYNELELKICNIMDDLINNYKLLEDFLDSYDH